MPEKTPAPPPDTIADESGISPLDREQSCAPSHCETCSIDAYIQLCGSINDFKQQDQLLQTIASFIPKVLAADGGAVLLWDRKENVLAAKAVGFRNTAHAARFKTERRPAGEGVGGRVLETGTALIVNDYNNSPYRYRSAGSSNLDWICNRMDVPLKIHGRNVGVLSAINKNSGDFHQADVELLSSVSGITALALENIRIRESLADYYRQMKDFNRAKDSVIHQLSHALKTPLAVVMASLKLLRKYLNLSPDKAWLDIYDRIQRNLARLLTIEYEMEDILRQRQENSTMAASLTMSPGDSSMVESEEVGDHSDESDQNGGKL